MDNGREQEQGAVRSSSRAQTMEAQSGQESFISYVQRQVQEIQAGDWQTFHAELARKGIGYRLRGNGAIFTDLNGITNCKASRVGREFSRASLEKNYGKFQVFQYSSVTLQEEAYERGPRLETARKSSHWQRYLNIREERKKAYDELRAELDARYADLNDRFRRNYSGIGSAMLTRKDRARLYGELKRHKKQAYSDLRAEGHDARFHLNTRYPATWTQYLQREAEKGDEEALKLLRSRAARKALEEEKPLKSRTAVNEALKELEAREEWKVTESRISRKGTVIVRLNCGELREYEDAIFMRPANPEAKEILSRAALRFAEIRWGQEQVLTQKKENSIARVPELAPELVRAERVR